MRPGIPLPWKAHGVLAVVFPLLLALPACVELGVADTSDHSDWFVSTGFFVAAWAVAVPLIFPERGATKRGLWGWSLLSAACAHAVLALFGMLPITLSLMLAGFGTPPIDDDLVRISVSTYTVLLAGYFAAHVLIDRIDSRLMASEAGAGR